MNNEQASLLAATQENNTRNYLAFTLKMHAATLEEQVDYLLQCGEDPEIAWQLQKEREDTANRLFKIYNALPHLNETSTAFTLIPNEQSFALILNPALSAEDREKLAQKVSGYLSIDFLAQALRTGSDKVRRPFRPRKTK